MDLHFRKATHADIPQIWDILSHAILRRKADGSLQWQDGYPNLDIIQTDLNNDAGYVLSSGDTILGYCAIVVNDEPAYATIDGKWLTQSDFLVVHRLAISENQLGKGYAKMIFERLETWAISKNVFSIKADTNFDNPAMLNIFKKLGYAYCGEVHFRGNSRKAYEKVLAKNAPLEEI